MVTFVDPGKLAHLLIIAVYLSHLSAAELHAQPELQILTEATATVISSHNACDDPVAASFGGEELCRADHFSRHIRGLSPDLELASDDFQKLSSSGKGAKTWSADVVNEIQSQLSRLLASL